MHEHDRWSEARGAALHAGCRSGEAGACNAAFETLWREYVYPYALKLARDVAWAEDIAQAAIERIWRGLPEVRQPGQFLAWARKVVYRVFVDQYHVRQAGGAIEWPPSEADEVEPVIADGAPDLDADPAAGDLRAIILCARCLSERERRVICGTFLDELSDVELAQRESARCGARVSPANIQVTRSKALAKLRDYFPLRAYFGLAEAIGEAVPA